MSKSAKYWVAELLQDRIPLINGMYWCRSENEALDLVVKLAQEQGSTDTAADIRSEASTDGVYRAAKYAEWSICWGEVGKPTK